MGIDLEAAKKMLSSRKVNDNNGNSGDLRWYNLPDEGSDTVRILPPTEGSPVPGMLVSKHWNLVEKSSFNCLKTWNMNCPICDVIEKYESMLDVTDWVANCSAYFNVLVPENQKYDPTLPYIMRSSDYMFYWLLEQLVNPKVGDITDPHKGHDIIFKRKSFKGSFDRTFSLQPSPIAPTEEAIQTILKSMYKLDQIWKTPDDETVKNATDAAMKLTVVIKERLLSLENNETPQSQASPQETAPPTAEETPVTAAVSPPQETPPETPPLASTQKANFDIPPKAPNCFGTLKYNEESKACMICPYEFGCSEISSENKLPAPE